MIGVEGLGMEFEIYEVLKVQDWSSRSKIGVQSLGLEFKVWDWSFQDLGMELKVWSGVLKV